MHPENKAEQIKQKFKLICQDIPSAILRKKIILLFSREYINGILENGSLQSGNYNDDYEHQWHRYTSYWYKVLISL